MYDGVSPDSLERIQVSEIVVVPATVTLPDIIGLRTVTKYQPEAANVLDAFAVVRVVTVRAHFNLADKIIDGGRECRRHTAPV